MNKYLKQVVWSFLVELFALYKRANLELLQIEVTRGLLEGVETLRQLCFFLVAILVVAGVMSAGIVLCITSAAFAMFSEITVYTTPLLISGLICFCSSLVIFMTLLSSLRWMKILKENQLIGPFITDTLNKVNLKK